MAKNRTMGLIGRIALVGFAASAGIYAAACGGASQPAAPAAPAAAKFSLEGKIVDVDRQHKELVVDHKEIPGFMSAMTMPYPVKTPSDLDKVSVGDQITADLVSSDGQFKLDNIVVVKKAETKAGPVSGAKPQGH